MATNPAQDRSAAYGPPFPVIPETDQSRLLRELADAVDKDRGYDKSFLTRTMREAATDLDRAEARLERTNADRAHWRERARSAEQALGLYGEAQRAHT